MARRRRWGCLSVVIALAVLFGVFAVADEVARRAAEQRVQSELAAQLGTGASGKGSLTVKLTGWPFSQFLITNRLSGMRLTGSDVTLSHSGKRVVLQTVDADLSKISNPLHPDNAVIGTLDATGLLSWAEASTELGVTMTGGQGDRLVVNRTITLSGTTVPILISVVPGVDATGERLTLSDPQASFGGVELPASLLQPVATAVADQTHLPSVKGIAYRSLTATSQGLQLAVHGVDVALSSVR